MFNIDIGAKKDVINYDEVYDFIALGLGPGGLNAGLYAGRKGLKTLVVGHDFGGQLKNTSEVDNYLGVGLVDATKLISMFKTHLETLEIPLLTNVIVTKIEKKANNLFHVTLNNDKVLQAKTLLYAFGGNPRKLEVPGEHLLAGRGISYCVTCDGPFYKGQDVIVAGGGNSAVDAAKDLARIAKSVTIIQRSTLRADQKSVDSLLKLPNVKVMLQTQIKGFIGDDKMEGVEIIDKRTGKVSVINAAAAFIEIGNIPNTALLQGLVDLNDAGEVYVNSRQETSLAGLYAAGDITSDSHRQIIIAAGDGAKAALEAANYINNQ